MAVYAAAANQAEMEDQILPVLEELGIEPVETGIMDAPTDDTAALEASVSLVAERFEVLFGGQLLLRGDVHARAGRSGISSGGPVDERAEAHGRGSYELWGS